MNTKKYTVLTADDNQRWCASLCKEIEKLHTFEVLPPVFTGNDALNSIEANRPDILLLDLIIPVYDGLYIVNYIQNNMRDYRPFIYVLSAIGTEKTNNIMQNLNVDYYSVKPIAPSAVATNIFHIARRWQQTEEKKKTSGPTHTQPVWAAIDVEQQVDDYLYELGVPLYRVSTKCLRLALRMALEDDEALSAQMQLYQKVGDAMPKPTKGNAVERNLRTAIGAIQKLDNSYYQHCFPEQKGNLSNSDFLNRSVFILRKRIGDFLSD